MRILAVTVVVTSVLCVFFTIPYTFAQEGIVGAGAGGDYSVDGYGSCEFVETVNNVITFLLSMSAVLAVIVFLYAGYTMVTSGGDSQRLETAKSVFGSVFTGFIIMLVAFLVINTVMKILTGNTSELLNWQTVDCQYANEVTGASEIKIGLKEHFEKAAVMSSSTGYYPDSVIRGTAGGATYSAGDCSPANLRRLGMTVTQANTFSCIARPESGCNLNAQNGWTSARGVFQMTRGWNDTCHNLNLPACTRAAKNAGYSVSGNLNCSTAFSGGSSPSNPSRPTPGKEALFNACNAAASNMACNVAASLCLYNDGGKYNHWLGNRGQQHHLAQRACVLKFDPSQYNY